MEEKASTILMRAPRFTEYFFTESVERTADALCNNFTKYARETVYFEVDSIYPLLVLRKFLML